jgi:hypothetical protein
MSAPAIGMAGLPEVPRAPAVAGFFEQPLPVRLILASFFLVTLPLAAVFAAANGLLMSLYLCLFGTTHFVITFAIYFRGENLEHFKASRRNQVIFFGVPLLIFAVFYSIAVFGVMASFPAFALLFRAVVRMADFNHLNRQSFGVLQLFLVRAGIKTAPWLKRAQNWYFNSLSGLLYCTYLAGGRSILLNGEAPAEPLASAALVRPLTLMMMAVAAALAVVIVTGLWKAWKQAGCRPGIGAALGYWTLQTLSALLPVISLPLYGAALAMHYVEYHVLMYPRCFHTELDQASAPDRLFARLRRNPIGFYGLLIGISALVYTTMAVSASLMGMAPGAGERSYLLVAALFDGLFIFHYFVEMYIWRFNDPFFRRTVGRLYFSRA